MAGVDLGRMDLLVCARGCVGVCVYIERVREKYGGMYVCIKRV